MRTNEINLFNSVSLPVIYKKNNVNNNQIMFRANTHSSKQEKSKNWLYYAVGCSVIISMPFVIKKILKGKSGDFVPDAFHKTIAQNLNKLGIKVKPKELQSIVSPAQFNGLVNKFKPEHYRVGLQVSQEKAANIPLEVFYQNAVDGNFRVSLHTHSNFSDGKAHVREFLDCARRYADKVAGMNKNDNLPPFTIALTDHDSVKGCIEIIKIIAQNPEKYKNLKFVSGCEFSVRDGSQHYDITGLALNPFDKGLNNELNSLAQRRKQVIDNFLEQQPLFDGKKITREQLADIEKRDYEQLGKKGKKCIQNLAGIVSVRHAIQYYYKTIGKDINKDVINQLGDKEILPIEKVVGIITQNGGVASLTHPIKSFWNYIGDSALKRLRDMGVSGIEVNHQYTPSKITKLGRINNVENSDDLFNQLIEKYTNFAKQNNMFLSGGTDSHERQIFSRMPKITHDLLEDGILN